MTPKPLTRTCVYCAATLPVSKFESERRRLGYVCKDGFACVERRNQLKRRG